MRFIGQDQLISLEAAGRGGYELVEPDKSHTTQGVPQQTDRRTSLVPPLLSLDRNSPLYHNDF